MTDVDGMTGGRRGSRGGRSLAFRLLLTALIVYSVYAWPIPAPMTRRQLYLARAFVSGTVTMEAFGSRAADLGTVNGRSYAAYPPLVAAVGAPTVAIGARGEEGPWTSNREARALVPFTLVVAVLPGALAVVALAWVLGVLGYDRRSRTQAALVLAFATPLFVYATIAYSNAMAAALLLLGVAALARAATRPKDERWAAAAGLAFGLAVLADYSAVWVAASMAVATLAGLGSRRALLLAAGAAGPAVVLGLFHYTATGNPLRPPTPDHVLVEHFGAMTHSEHFFSAPSPRLVFEILLGHAKGLLLYWPVLALGAWGLVATWREGKQRALIGGLLTGAALTVLANACMRTSSWFAPESFGPRYSFYVTVCLAVGLPAGMRSLSARWSQLLVAASFLVSWAGVQSSWQFGVFEAPLELLQAGPRLRSVQVLAGADGELLAVIAALVALPLVLLALLAVWRHQLPGKPRRWLTAVAVVSGLHLLLAAPYLLVGRGSEEAVRRAAARRGAHLEARVNESAPRAVIIARTLHALGAPDEAAAAFRQTVLDFPDDTYAVTSALSALLYLGDRDGADLAASALVKRPVPEIAHFVPHVCRTQLQGREARVTALVGMWRRLLVARPDLADRPEFADQLQIVKAAGG